MNGIDGLAASSSLAKLDVVVDLAVEHELERAIFVRHRLVARARQVDDRQPAMAQSDRPVDIQSLVVRAAMEHGVPEPSDSFRSDRPVPKINDGENSAHDYSARYASAPFDNRERLVNRRSIEQPVVREIQKTSQRTGQNDLSDG